jgi:hypothetical protein
LEHPLTQAALFQEILFQSAELLVEQEIRLVNEADGNVGDHLRRAGFHKLAVKFKRMWSLAAQPSHELRLFGVLVPNDMVTHAKVVAIVGEQFFETRPAHARELNLGFLRSERGFAAFEDVLFPGARGLDHLVHRAVAFAEILVREPKGEVVNDFGFLVGEQRLIIPRGGMIGWEEGESGER